LARFLHIADARSAEHIRRSGLLPARVGPSLRAVFCVPVVPDPSKTYQWARELRARGARSMVAVLFDLPDGEPVLFGRFNTKHLRITAVEAHRAFRATAGSVGQEVLIPRRVEAHEIRRIKPAPRLMGWRFYPEAKGRQFFWPLPGTIKANRRRKQLDEEWLSPAQDFGHDCLARTLSHRYDAAPHPPDRHAP